MSKKSNIWTILYDFLVRYPNEFFILFFLILIEGIVISISMLSIVPMTDYLLDETLKEISKITKFVIYIYSKLSISINFWSFGLIFILFNFFKGILEVGIRYSILKIKYKVVYGLFDDALDNFYKSKWEFFNSSENGILLNTLNKELNTIGDTFGHIATLFAQIIQLIILLTLPIYLNAALIFNSLGISILLGLPFLMLNNISYNLGKKNTESSNNAIGILSELLQASKLILGYGNQNFSKNRFLIAFRDHINYSLKSQILSTAVTKFFRPLAMLSVVISVGLEINKNTPISEITAVMWSMLSALPILAELLKGKISINNFIPSYEQLLKLKKKALNLKEIQGDKCFEKLLDRIEFKNVSFNYENRLSTLKNINLNLKRGSMVALVGESGSGKSTISDILLGLQIPRSGEINIDGVSLKYFNQNSYRQKIGYVPQDPLLFHCSIKDNLLWSKGNATDHEIWESLKLANADLFVKNLPEGLDTLVGERGLRLSGGQRQRIALARALIRKPELLILDEATSALDTESEKLIQSSIEKVSSNTTILVIAHRISTIINSDFVYVIDKGEIIESGSYKSLSKKKDGYLKKIIEKEYR